MRKIVVLAVAVAVAGISLFAYQRAHAQGQAFDVWIPAGTTVSTSTDRIVFIGKTTGSTQLTTACAAAGGAYPVQSIVAVDPAGGGAARLTGVVVGPFEAAPGTRIGTLVPGVPANCTDNGVTYTHLVGTVQ